MIGIISDIHGNYVALKAVLEVLDKMRVKDIYCVGDVVGYYSQVNECCNELRERNIKSVMGNHDWYMASGGFCMRSKSVNDCLAYQRKVISSENLGWLKNLPIQMEVDNMKILHGGWSDPLDEYLEPSEDYFTRIEGEIFISGHTHVQMLKKYKKKIYCNPGSVGQPRDNNPYAAFVTYGEQFQLHRVCYNFQEVFRLMEKIGFNDYYYGCLKTGEKNLCRLKSGRRKNHEFE